MGLPLVITLTLNILIPFLFWYFNQWPLRSFFELFLLVSMAAMILQYFPLILLHKNYLKKSKNIKLCYDEFNNYLYFRSIYSIVVSDVSICQTPPSPFVSDCQHFSNHPSGALPPAVADLYC